METTRNQLIHLLDKHKNGFISGQELSRQLNISRTAVWKHMKELEKDGYAIEAYPRKGYRINRFPEKMSANTLEWGLQTKWLGRNLVYHPTVSSTQLIAHRLAAEGAVDGTIVIAGEQTAGKGRMERNWHSAAGKGIWMSIILRPDILPHQAPQLTLLAATVLVEVLQQATGVKAAIKWPNDVLLNEKKMAGILTEMQAEQDRVQYLVLGLGVNINQTKEEWPPEVRQLATSLFLETGEEWKLPPLIQQFLLHLEKEYGQFLSQGFIPVKTKWENYAWKMGETVEIQTMRGNWTAKLQGIGKDGALIVVNPDGSRQTLYSAEIKW